MNNFFKIVFFQLFFYFSMNGQSVKSELENKDFFYIEFDIRSESAQPSSAKSSYKRLRKCPPLRKVS